MRQSPLRQTAAPEQTAVHPARRLPPAWRPVRSPRRRGSGSRRLFRRHLGLPDPRRRRPLLLRNRYLLQWLLLRRRGGLRLLRLAAALLAGDGWMTIGISAPQVPARPKAQALLAPVWLRVACRVRRLP